MLSHQLFKLNTSLLRILLVLLQLASSRKLKSVVLVFKLFFLAEKIISFFS